MPKHALESQINDLQDEVDALSAVEPSVEISTVSVAFTDGDTMRRVTVSDGAVTATSKIICSVTRATVADEDDMGIFFQANVVSRGTGTFDVIVVARGWGFSDPVGIVNETITLNYLVSA